LLGWPMRKVRAKARPDLCFSPTRCASLASSLSFVELFVEQSPKSPAIPWKPRGQIGEGGIRTHGADNRTTAFESASGQKPTSVCWWSWSARTIKWVWARHAARLSRGSSRQTGSSGRTSCHAASAFRTLGTGFETTNRKEGRRLLGRAALVAAARALNAARFIAATLPLW
jgi:hypothetical protein